MAKSIQAGTLVALCGILLAPSAFGSARSPSPKAVFTALLTTAYPDSQLPHGFSSAKVGLSQPSSNAKNYHVVGEVEVAVDGPDPDDGLSYYVFPDAASAQGDLTHPRPSSGEKIHNMGRVPGYSQPSTWVVGSITGKNAFGKTVTNGVTALAVREGNVLIAVYNDSSDNPDSGNMPAALALLKSAIKHLHAVQAKLH